MSVSRVNAEGYHDPVAYEALSRVRKEERAAARAEACRPLVYVCSPYAGDTERNAEAARRYCRFAVGQGVVPLAPHLLFPQFVDEGTERELALRMGMALLGRCGQVWVFGGIVSKGMAAEIRKAERMRKKVRYFMEDKEGFRETGGRSGGGKGRMEGWRI